MSQDKYTALRREAIQARRMTPKPTRYGLSQARDIAVGLLNPLALLPLSNDKVERIVIASAMALFTTALGLAFFSPDALQSIIGTSPWLLERLMPLAR
ncbi:MAG: hypothetical protein Q8Q41_03515 [bacterium]|nr:hypothetical protein [bacterium]